MSCQRMEQLCSRWPVSSNQTDQRRQTFRPLVPAARINSSVGLAWSGVLTIPNNRRAVVIVSRRIPVRHRAEHLQSVVGLSLPVLWLELVEKAGDVTPPYAYEWPSSPFTRHAL
jgi:hypothetical protein